VRNSNGSSDDSIRGTVVVVTGIISGHHNIPSQCIA
jgi:hypothetical protein